LERIGKAQEDGAAQLAGLMSRYVERLGELKDTALNHAAEVRELKAVLAGGVERNPSPTPPKEGRGSGTGL